jgi:hypothetical protein
MLHHLLNLNNLGLKKSGFTKMMLEQLYFSVSLFACSIILSVMVKSYLHKDTAILNITLLLSKKRAIYILNRFNDLTNFNHKLPTSFPWVVYCCYGGLHMPREAADA